MGAAATSLVLMHTHTTRPPRPTALRMPTRPSGTITMSPLPRARASLSGSPRLVGQFQAPAAVKLSPPSTMQRRTTTMSHATRSPTTSTLGGTFFRTLVPVPALDSSALEHPHRLLLLQLELLD